IMYGRPPDCSAPCPCHLIEGLFCEPVSFGTAPPCCTLPCSIYCHPDGGVPLLPGWADLFANSALVNGRPINGSVPIPPNTTCDFLHPCDCDFIQPCPDRNGVTSSNYLVTPAGIQIGDLLLSAYGSGKVDLTNGTGGDGAGTYVRVTG